MIHEEERDWSRALPAMSSLRFAPGRRKIAVEGNDEAEERA
jgi:hypothetical protein